MEIYLDANATTPVLPQARDAALRTMAEAFGNPSSIHSTGLRARALMDAARASARRVLGAAGGRLLFNSGATEGIQTAVLSALAATVAARAAGEPARELLLYGATEHKAVPEAIAHWNRLLGLALPMLAIPVDRDGRHDLAWLAAHAPRAALVCTMAANNETGVVSDLDGIEAALAGSPALWLVDGVQALGKLPLELDRRRIDYAPFSGHKLYAPKGIGLLYVREGAPFTPLMAGGGQEGGLRSGTENMAGIAALGAVLQALESGGTFRSAATLADWRRRLAGALCDAFAGLVFNAAFEHCLPTTLNFSVPGLASRLLLDAFDAAGLRCSGGSACGAARAQPSYVLEAMGLPAWRTASAVRLSFGPATDEAVIKQACARIRACGDALRASGPDAATPGGHLPADGLTRWTADGACCYLLADAASRRCVVIDPLPALADRIVQWRDGHGYRVDAVLATEGREAGAQALRGRLLPALATGTPDAAAEDASGWPLHTDTLAFGRRRLLRLPAAAAGAPAFVLLQEGRSGMAFIGDTPPAAWAGLLPADTLLLPASDGEGRLASRAGAEPAEPMPAAALELDPTGLRALAAGPAPLVLVDVRESFEQALGAVPELGTPVRHEAVALSRLLDALPGWLALPPQTPLLFFCRSGNRSRQAAQLLRRLGRARSFSLAGGLALWPEQAPQPAALQPLPDEALPA